MTTTEDGESHAEGACTSGAFPREWLEEARREFDGRFYLRSYSDVKEAGVDPFLHYMTSGWTEGRDPSPAFKTSRYLELHGDVRHAGWNPFLHYIVHGRAEGRPIDWDPNDPRSIIREAVAPSVRAGAWIRPPPAASLTERSLIILVRKAALQRRRGLIVSISHDDYVENVGGTQNIVGDEMRSLSASGFAYLHLCPAQPLPMLAPLDHEDSIVGIRLDGLKIGLAHFSELIRSLRSVRQELSSCYIVVHHLLGSCPEEVAELVRVVEPDRVFAYLHDFFALCTSYTLLRNDVAYCNAPPLTSGACMVCCHGEEREQHVARMQAFLTEVRPTMCIYSHVAREIWKARSPFAPLDVLPIRVGRVELHEDVVPRSVIVEGREPLRVAFLGTPHYLKGWTIFAKLARDFQVDSRYRFFQLSAHRRPQESVTHIPVAVRPNDRLAMVRALQDERIDVALIWSMWPETFCFTAYEAMAAGAFVVTSRGSGNVWHGVSAEGPRQGAYLQTVQELYDLFASGDIISFACAPGRRRGDLVIEAPLADHIASLTKEVAFV